LSETVSGSVLLILPELCSVVFYAEEVESSSVFSLCRMHYRDSWVVVGLRLSDKSPWVSVWGPRTIRSAWTSKFTL